MALTMNQLNALYNDMSVYGDTYKNSVAPMAVNTNVAIGATEQDLNATQQDQETGIGEILIPNINTDYLNQSNDNQYVNKNIDYNNLIIPSLKSEPQSNMFTDAMGNIKSFAEKNKLLSGIMKAGSMIRDPITGAITSLLGMLPEQDPRATATKNFYDENFGVTSSGSVASGIMQGYNPVYGSDFLNKISQGIIPESGYGLTPAIDKRIAKINETLKKYDKYKYGSEAFDKDKYNQQIEKIRKLELVKAKEAEALQQVKEKEYQERITEEANTAARARAANAAVYREADERGYTNSDGGFSTSAADKAGTSEGSGQFSSSSGRGRTGYGTGGIVSL